MTWDLSEGEIDELMNAIEGILETYYTPSEIIMEIEGKIRNLKTNTYSLN